MKAPAKTVKLKAGKHITLKWTCRISSRDEPWVAILVADNDLNNRKELIGSAWEK